MTGWAVTSMPTETLTWLAMAFILVANLGRDVVPPVSATSNFADSSKLNSQLTSNSQSSSATEATQNLVLSLPAVQQSDAIEQEEKQAVPLAVSVTPNLAGSQQLDDAFASDDWLI